MEPRMRQLSVTIDSVETAAKRIAPHTIRTPTVLSPGLSQLSGAELWLKCENLQHVGAFKARGACNAVLALTDADAARGVVTHSSGNHAAALARAARIRGITAHVVMPNNSARVKLNAVRALGVEPILCEPTAAARAAMAKQVMEQTGAVMVHPYDNPLIIAGQGTVGLEILDQMPMPDVVLAPVGGGGLLSGVLIAIKSLSPDVEVIAAEPAWADDARRSLDCGSIQQPVRYDSIADGLRTPLGELTFPIIRELVDDILLVEESAIREATRVLLSSAKLLAEPSGAVTTACVLQHASRFAGRRVAAVISGGNLDDDRLSWHL